MIITNEIAASLCAQTGRPEGGLNSLIGEVLLEILPDGGLMTAPQEVVKAYQLAPPQRKIDGGWNRYESVLQSVNLPDVVPVDLSTMGRP